MTRTEVIQSIAAQAGVPAIEAGKFMEIFLQKLSANILEGQAFFLPGFGSFRPLSVIGSPRTGPSEHPVIIFHPEGSFNTRDDLVFRVPSVTQEISNQLDLYFSLSINKPLIPSKDEAFTPDDIPSSPLEFRKFADLKADEILQLGETRLSDFDDSQYLQENFTKQGETPKDTSTWNPHVTWEFGSDWKKEYEEEKLLETEESSHGDEFNLSVTESESDINWDFGGEEEPQKTDEKVEELIPPAEQLFAEVKSKTRELEVDLTELEEKEDEPVEDFDALFRKSMADNIFSALPTPDQLPSEDTFQQVRSTREIPDLPPLEDEQSDSLGIDLSSLVVDLKGSGKPAKKKVEATGIKDVVETGKKKKKRGKVLWGILGVLIFGAGSLALYIRLYGKPAFSEKPIEWVEEKLGLKKAVVLPVSPPLIIERDYDVPVAYPYPASMRGNVLAGSGDSTISGDELQLERNTVLPLQTNPRTPVPRSGAVPPNKSERVRTQQNQRQSTGGVQLTQPSEFPSGEPEQPMKNKKPIQIASVKAEQTAIGEVERLRQAGKNASYQRVDLGARGVWYRITVSK